MRFTYIKNTFIALFTIIICSACSDPLEEIRSTTPDLNFLNAEFSYVNSINTYGVPADHWAEGSKMTFYYLSDSESGKPQGRFIWTFEEEEQPTKAWWRLDRSKNATSVFGKGGTARHLSLTDLHREVKTNWRTVFINAPGHLIIDQTHQDPMKWEFECVAKAPTWDGQ